MDEATHEILFDEYRRLRALAASQANGPGRMSALGCDLEHPSPGSLLACVDYIVFRRMNDFIADHDRPVILDCGANIGYTTSHYKRRFPGARITAFEPDPKTPARIHSVAEPRPCLHGGGWRSETFRPIMLRYSHDLGFCDPARGLARLTHRP